MLTTIRDMSKWQELEKHKNLSQMKTIAFAQAAHEFRNPLNAITQSLDMIESTEDEERKSFFFKVAKQSSKLMMYLVNDILDYSQLESNKFILNLDNLSLRLLIKECLDILSFKA